MANYSIEEIKRNLTHMEETVKQIEDAMNSVTKARRQLYTMAAIFDAPDRRRMTLEESTNEEIGSLFSLLEQVKLERQKWLKLYVDSLTHEDYLDLM